jgi:hypothetical protein
MSHSFYETSFLGPSTSGNSTLVDISDRIENGPISIPESIRENLRILVMNYSIASYGDVDVKFISGTTNITDTMPLASKGNFFHSTSSNRECPIFVCGKNEDLIINLSASVKVSIHLGYYIL